MDIKTQFLVASGRALWCWLAFTALAVFVMPPKPPLAALSGASGVPGLLAELPLAPLTSVYVLLLVVVGLLVYGLVLSVAEGWRRWRNHRPDN